jgi:tRNA pseudouridine38-40 synthase
MDFYKSIVAYDGTDFQGFQRQAPEIRTVQGELERALTILGWQEASIKAAGRTDAGVHAIGQVISYAFIWRAGEEALTRALNANLPKDISIWKTEHMDEDFHPRFSALRRRYRYAIFYNANRDPLRERYAWRIWPEPSMGEMVEAAKHLLGRHDFRAFGSPPIQGGHTIKEISDASWRQEGDRSYFGIEADSFLHKMIRRLVALIVDIGLGRAAQEEMNALIDHPSCRREGAIAPPNGLCLEAVIYAP